MVQNSWSCARLSTSAFVSDCAYSVVLWYSTFLVGVGLWGGVIQRYRNVVLQGAVNFVDGVGVSLI